MSVSKVDALRRWIGTLTGHRVESRILVVFVVSVALAFGLGKLASEVLEGDSFALDRLIMRGLRVAGDPALPVAPRGVTTAMMDVTALGGVTVLTIVTLFAAGYLLALGEGRTAVFVTGSVALGAAATTILKQLFGRVRPDFVPHLVPVDTTSFPSGHAMNSALVYLTLATLVARTEEDTRLSVYLVGSAVITTLLVGASRVYLGVHYPSDVVAGWGVGGLWAVLSTLAFKRFGSGGSDEVRDGRSPQNNSRSHF